MPSYGHSHQGFNLANYRIVAEKASSPLGHQPYRTTADWALETGRHVDLGATEKKNSSSLRVSSNAVQALAADQVVADTSSVEASLRAKIRHTEQLKEALHNTAADTLTEIQHCVVLKASLEQRLGKVQEKAALNESRLTVRSSRPLREKTMDGVEGMLLQQKGLVSSFEDKVRRAHAGVERQVQQLERCRCRLEADLRDKAEAIDVDSRALSVQPGAGGSRNGAGALVPEASATASALLPRARGASVSSGGGSGGAMRTPNAWVHRTEENIREARKYIADSVRLRKAIRHSVQEARLSEHATARSLNQQIVNKIGATRGLKVELEQELARLHEEQAQAWAQRASLVAAIEAKRSPLQQAQERLQARTARPEQEQVADDVQAALRAEIAHLNAMSSQLTNKLAAVDKTIDSLDLAALVLEDNIRDKDATLLVEERMALMDGRVSVAQPPPSSVGSVYSASSHSSLHDAALRRIQDLESELSAARKEREGMEANIAALRASVTPGAGGSNGGGRGNVSPLMLPNGGAGSGGLGSPQRVVLSPVGLSPKLGL